MAVQGLLEYLKTDVKIRLNEQEKKTFAYRTL